MRFSLMNTYINPFVPNAPFLNPPEISENRQGVEKGCVRNEWVSFSIKDQNRHPIETDWFLCI